MTTTSVLLAVNLGVPENVGDLVNADVGANAEVSCSPWEFPKPTDGVNTLDRVNARVGVIGDVLLKFRLPRKARLWT
jgi:hypothetical protein